MAPDRLTARQLNRATLARQSLLARADRTVLSTVEHLVGLQAQAPSPPYFGLWSRLSAFQPDDLARLILDRSVVRIAVMRGTVHLVSAADCRVLRPLLQPMYERLLRTNTIYGKALRDLDFADIARQARELLSGRPMTTNELGPLLAERFPGTEPVALAHAARSLLPLVQLPPRGVWGRSGQPVCSTAEEWLGGPLEEQPSIEDVVLRYFAAFGPATVADAQAWSGLTRLGEVVERLGSRLREFTDDRGRRLYDPADAPRPDPDTPAPVRFLAPFDNLLLSYADRTRVLSDEDRKVVFTQNGIIRGTILVGGLVHGQWDIARGRGTATLTVTPFRPLSKRDASALTAEGRRLLRFAEPAARSREVVIAAVG
jgi:Winged helix DNA-binding domain